MKHCLHTLLSLYVVCTLTISVLGFPIGTEVIVRDKNPRVERIIINVRRRRSKHWDFWQLNSNICPPSLCYSNGGGVPTRPKGTGGSVFYNGDIVLDKESSRYIYGDITRRKRAATRLTNRLWPKGIVYFVFADDISKGAKRAVRKAMKHISERVCITFKKKRNKNQDYIRFISEPGCWSNVGRVGGEQKLSLGFGCEREGTAIHEISHALGLWHEQVYNVGRVGGEQKLSLGFGCEWEGTAIREISHALGLWHEQARPDRDKYVEIIEENISPRYKPDFDKVNRTLINSRGYPYDYRSIMHYSERTFTNTGGKTIKVIGVGKDLALRIGQRTGLSNLDIAQLRDMYYCNRKKDSNETVCPKGWVKEKRSCYRFIRNPKYQYAAASKYCGDFFSDLAHINNRYEDAFLKKYLKKNFPKTKTWRIGGRRINDTFVWERVNNRKTSPIKYKNWPKGEPSAFTAMSLAREKTSEDFQWQGIWTGSLSQMPQHAYPFICERKARRKCYPGKYKDGRDYRGTLDQTVDGITCQNWTSKYPHRHSLLADGKIKDNSDGLGEHNYCRNPKRERKKRPWCFTTKEKIEWQYCDVTTCSKTIIKQENKDTQKNKLPSDLYDIRTTVSNYKNLYTQQNL